MGVGVDDAVVKTQKGYNHAWLSGCISSISSSSGFLVELFALNSSAGVRKRGLSGLCLHLVGAGGG